MSCGGASDDSGTTPQIDYAGYQAQLALLQTSWAGVAITVPSTLPISGSATFNGVMSLTVETGTGSLDMAGKMTLNSDFSNDRLTGGANNFVDENDIAMSGSLVISGGVLDRGADTSVAHTFGAIIDGTLGTVGNSFVIGGDLSGDFLGLNNSGMSGIINGFATSNFGTGYMFGSFFAEQ